MSATPPGCADLARQLPGLFERQNALDEATLRFRPGTAEHYSAECAMNDTWRRIWAIEDLILATPAESLADAVAVILMSINQVRRGIECDGAQAELEAAERGLRGVLRMVAAAAGVKAADMAFAEYLVEPLPADPTPQQEGAATQSERGESA